LLNRKRELALVKQAEHRLRDYVHSSTLMFLCGDSAYAK